MINEFLFQMKNVLVDPDEDDDKYFKEFGGLAGQVFIIKNANFDRKEPP